MLFYSQHCPPVVQPYLEHSAYFLQTLRNSNCLILCSFVRLCDSVIIMCIPPSHRRRGATTGFGQNLHHLSDTASNVFPYPSHMCFSSRCYCGTRAESRRNHSGVIADMAIPSSYHCGFMTVPRRSLAAGQRCWR